MMDLIPINGEGVKGSHGRMECFLGERPLIVSQFPDLLSDTTLKSVDIYNVMYRHLFEKSI